MWQRSVACTTIAVSLVATTGARGDTGVETLRIVSAATTVRTVDVRPRGRSPGDMEFVTQVLYAGSVPATVVGAAEMLCTQLIGRARSCQGTYVLRRGRIETGGVIEDRFVYELAITGGTRWYAAARGELVVTTTALHPLRQVLVFRLRGLGAPTAAASPVQQPAAAVLQPPSVTPPPGRHGPKGQAPGPKPKPPKPPKLKPPKRKPAPK